jgi:hypothetical protein
MSNTPHINNQAVQQAPEGQETRPERPERAPSHVAESVSRADSHGRSYQQQYAENDFRTIEAGDRSVTILSSENVGDTFDPEKDRAYAISVATASQYRRFERGSDKQAEGNSPADSSVDKTILANGIRRGTFRV